MTIKVLVNGAFGRMGQLTTKTILDHPHFELVGQTGREYDLQKAIKDSEAEIVIDFTRPDAVFANTSTIIDCNARPVIGTSGLTEEQVARLQKRCESLKLGGIIAPNFSLGGVLMMKYAKEIVKYIPHVEIIEMHHEGKADSPSGTAMRTAEMIAEKAKAINKKSEERVKGARGASHLGVPVHSVRLPGFLASQQVIFGNVGETLTLRHDTIDRQCFMPGVILACEKVMHLDRLIYGMEEIL